MKLDENTVARIAHLARLEVEAGEEKSLLNDMNNILSFMEKLNELDTTGVEPLIYMTDEVNVFREDIVKQDITVNDALRNAPASDESFFKVAKVIDKPVS